MALSLCLVKSQVPNEWPNEWPRTPQTVSSFPSVLLLSEHSLALGFFFFFSFLETGSAGHSGACGQSQHLIGRGRQCSVSSGPAWSTKWVPGQPGLHRETLSWKTKPNQNKNQPPNKTKTNKQTNNKIMGTYGNTKGLLLASTHNCTNTHNTMYFKT